MTTTGPVWITRAQPGAARTAARLAALGFTPVVVPLLAIRRIPQGPPDLTDVAALVFTSRNGVAAFAALAPAPVIPTGMSPTLATTAAARDLPVLTVGDATAQAARDAGFHHVRSAAGALEDLAALIRAKWAGPSGVLLHPVAREPAGDLAAAVGETATVRSLPVYEAVETGAAPPAAFDVVMVHSPRAARALAQALPPEQAGGRIAVAISSPAAAPLAACGFAEIRIAATPDETALIAALGNGPGRV